MLRLYLDEDSASALLIHLLKRAGHDVQAPAEVGMDGKSDPVQFTHAVREGRIILTHNHEDFKELHHLVEQVQGHHLGILVVRREKDPSKNLLPPNIVRAIRNLEAAGVPVADQYIILNHWR
jgi:predicted nuclease of predicted toxin-antitoxin system